MRFLCFYKPAKAETTQPTEQEICNMGKFIEDSMKSGILIATEGCMPSANGARLRKTNGSFKITDGPFTEAKEIVGGFALINANSLQEAIEYSKTFMNLAGDGETEIRQIYDHSSIPQNRNAPLSLA
jgi:hypothetical protein